MKYLILAATVLLSGCGTIKSNDYQQYVETSRSISKDNTISQTACWTAIAEIAKGGDNATKIGAIALAEKCKNETIKIEPPRKNLF